MIRPSNQNYCPRWYKISTYYDEKLSYIIGDLNFNTFDLKVLKDKIIELFASAENYDEIESITIIITIKSIDYEFLEEYRPNIIKNHEIREVIDKIINRVKNGLKNRVDVIQKTISKSNRYKNLIRIVYKEKTQNPQPDILELTDQIQFDFILKRKNMKKLQIKEIITFATSFNHEDLGFSKEIFFNISMKLKREGPRRKLFSGKIPKIEIGGYTNFLSLSHKDIVLSFLTNSEVKDIHKNYLLPYGPNTPLEITYDKLREGNYVQKRRGVYYNKDFPRLHDIYNEISLTNDYNSVFNKNNIGGLYCGTRSRDKNEIAYLIIDIDVNNRLVSIFNSEIIWKLVLEISKTIVSTAISLGFPKWPAISFSGMRGVHIIWKIEKNIASDREGIISIPHFINDTLPGRKKLFKSLSSCVHDKFKFFKQLARALCLYSIYSGEIKIPEDIKYKLLISSPRQLFSLSVFTSNDLSVLLDTSSINKGVFRIFSPHPKTTLISVPIFDTKPGRFLEEYNSYEKLKLNSKIETVLTNIQNNNTKIYRQFPASITRDNLNSILTPNKLLPSFYVLLRFGARYVLERSAHSYQWWHRYFQLFLFYDYINKQLLQRINNSKDPLICSNIRKLGKECKILNSAYISHLIYLYLFTDKIKYSILIEKLDALKNFEFFFKLMPNVFTRRPSELVLIFKTKNSFKNFCQQFSQMLTIMLETLIFTTTTKDLSKIEDKELSAIMDLYIELDNMIEERNASGKDEDVQDYDIMIKEIYLIYIFYLSILKFLRTIFIKQPKE